jgi:hypothetical protein
MTASIPLNCLNKPHYLHTARQLLPILGAVNPGIFDIVFGMRNIMYNR